MGKAKAFPVHRFLRNILKVLFFQSNLLNRHLWILLPYVYLIDREWMLLFLLSCLRSFFSFSVKEEMEIKIEMCTIGFLQRLAKDGGIDLLFFSFYGYYVWRIECERVMSSHLAQNNDMEFCQMKRSLGIFFRYLLCFCFYGIRDGFMVEGDIGKKISVLKEYYCLR